jgi:hypothetical protein
MKCTRCAAEVPGQAQFCMRCGTPVNVGRPGATAVAAHPAINYAGSAPRKSKLPLILTALALLAAIGVIVALKLRPNAKVTDVNARPADTGNLVNTNARIKDTAPLASSKANTTPGPADPVEIIDYLKHVREIERQRVALSKQQLGQALAWSSGIQAANLQGEMSDNPEEQHKQDYSKFQASFAQWATQWENLARAFNAYPKQIPQSCVQLRDKYLDVVGKTSASVTTVGNSLSQALSGDPTNALQALSGLQGGASSSIDRACDSADSEVAAICNKYNIHKDFDIKADGGSSNPFGVGR